MIRSISLYIHLPFCVSRCRYCDFYSETGADSALMAKVLERLLLDTRRELAALQAAGIATVYIGGGTPSLIPPAQLAPFLAALSHEIGGTEEFSMEINPESLSEELLDALSPLSRLSMGAQSYDERLLRWLGRPAGRRKLLAADELLRKNWHGRLSHDLLAALPRRPNALTGEIEQALKYGAGHLSLYDLTVGPGTPLAGDVRRLEELPGEEEKQAEWAAALEYLKRRGFHRYEVSNFARRGEECLHNVRYWRMEPYLGIGPGAASTLPGDGGAVRRQEPPDTALWLRSPGAGREQEQLCPRDFAFEHYMMALRTAEGLSRSRFAAVFGLDPVDIIPETARHGGLEADADALRLRDMDLTDAVLRDVLEDLEKVHFPGSYDWP
ncbi:MAG: hypothetical protein B0D92_07095 [Spirochaeta sp. LUC14_002_19_P3]|nr:MAG: hypothetical protein B0D92_07095 [Spirochaeta sp. LUC14_002_19_P3]